MVRVSIFEIRYLEMTLEIEEEVLRLDITMGNPLIM